MTQGTIRLPQEADKYSQAAGLISHALSQKYGGFTIYVDCEGGWLEDEKILTETVNVWEVYTDMSKSEVFNHLRALAVHVNELTGESVVMITVNHDHDMV